MTSALTFIKIGKKQELHWWFWDFQEISPLGCPPELAGVQMKTSSNLELPCFG
jgi:hypothetical protein